VFFVSNIESPATHYDLISSSWKYLLGQDFHYGYFQKTNESLKDATNNLTSLMAVKAGICPDMTVLDVGCGIGNPACLLAKRYGCRVVGISTSRIGIECCKALASERGCSDRVSFFIADGMDNHLQGSSFDIVWILESSHLMPRKNALIDESARVLRRGGRLVLCDVVLIRNLRLSHVLAHAHEFTCLNSTFGSAKMETLETYRQLANRSGFRVTELIDLTEHTKPTFGHWLDNLNQNAEYIRSQLGDTGLQNFRASCGFLVKLWEQRILGYGLLVAVKE
jgi:27-O-demethylrifamycin SV methyltransferase